MKHNEHIPVFTSNTFSIRPQNRLALFAFVVIIGIAVASLDVYVQNQKLEVLLEMPETMFEKIWSRGKKKPANPRFQA